MGKSQQINVFKLLSIFLAIALAIVLISKKTEFTSKNTEKVKTLSTSEQVFKNILSRSSVRDYTKEIVSDEKIDTLLRAAMAAPTAGNRQPWNFIVITDTMKIRALGQTLHFARRQLSQASLVIIVAADLDKQMKSTFFPYWPFDTSAATENILLQAHAMGLGAVWSTVTHDKKEADGVCNIINAPKNIQPMAAIVIGYPKGNSHAKDKYKSENIFYNQF